MKANRLWRPSPRYCPDRRIIESSVAWSPAKSFTPPVAIAKTAILLDVETTGLDQRKDEAIELGMVKFDICPMVVSPASETSFLHSTSRSSLSHQKSSLEAMIRSAIESGRTVTFAVKRAPPPAPATAAEILPELDGGETLTVEEALVKLTN